jgi:bacteriocin-like protein
MSKKLTLNFAGAAKGVAPVGGAPDARGIQELSDDELDKVSGGKHYAPPSGGALDLGKGPTCEVCGRANSGPIGYNVLGLKRSELVFKCACNSLIDQSGKRCGPPAIYY